LGPDGNNLRAYSDDYFTDRYDNEWGDAINFDGPGSGKVREFFIQNACYWIAEFHLDGLRLDATQQIFDASDLHILAELSQHVRAVAAPRTIVLIGENEPQHVRALAPIDRGSYGLDALWNDDFHHTARVALTGRREAYYTDYRGSAQELISAIKRGFLYQGQRYHWQKKPRGSVVTDEPAMAFVCFTQNHDQVANSLWGRRIHAMCDPARYRALTALMLLAPQTPMLFMGQEFGASTPFLYFTDHRQEDLAHSVLEGRRTFLAQYPSYASPKAQEQVPDSCDPKTFEHSKLDLNERQRHAELYRFHQDLLRLRREDPIIARQARDQLDGAVLGPEALVIRYFTESGEDRLLVVNLGLDLEYIPAPEPLLAPVPGGRWQLVWSSDDPAYGGPGVVNPLNPEGWRIPGASTALFVAQMGTG
jgi:maltooligosyltrehalose trehalohydrolase